MGAFNNPSNLAQFDELGAKMIRQALVGIATLGMVLVAGCSSGPSVPTVQSSESATPEAVVDERFEDEPFSQTEKIDICTQVSDLANRSNVLDGEPRVDIVEEPEWFCRIDNIEWIKLDAGATIELAFREYTDEEIQNFEAETAKNGIISICDLITFYEGDLVLTDAPGSPPSCWLQTTIHNTAYIVRNSTAITLKLQLEGSPEEHTTYDLHDDDTTVYMKILELLDRY